MPLPSPNDYLLRRQQRFYSLHTTFLEGADAALQDLEDQRPGAFDHAFIAITFSSLALEAFFNAVGFTFVNDFATWERCSPIEKLRSLRRSLGILPSSKSRGPRSNGF